MTTPLEIAVGELLKDVHELPDPGESPRIAEYLRTVGIGPDDETPWCSAFVNWCVAQAGGAGTGKGNARSWLTWGVPSGIRPGAIAVFWRGARDGWQGHVAFVLGEAGGSVIVLGGNQGNAVSVTAYSKERLLGCRAPRPREG